MTDRARRVRRDLRAIVADGCAFSVMVGAGETYLAAFALAVGLGEVAAGLIAAVPLLGGALLQLVSPYAVRRLGSHRLWVVICAVCQALSFAPLVAGAVMGRMHGALLFAVVTLYWAAGLATGPAWNTWVGTLVPHRVRARFFAMRTRLSQCAILVGVAGGGLVLDFGAGHGHRLAAFALLFAIAGSCRFISAGFLASQREPEPMPAGHRRLLPPELLRRTRGAAGNRLLVYMVAVQAAVQFAAPYFTPFMLEQLSFSYAQYLLLISTSYAAKMLSLPAIGHLASRLGSQRLLYAAGFGIVPMSALWILSDSLAFLLCVQIVGGVAWAAYELATFLLLFERIPPVERTSVLTRYNLANAAATVAGAALGGALLGALGPDRAAYYVLFALSGAARLLTIPLLRRLEPVEAVAAGGPVPARSLAVRPNTGSLDAPLVAGINGVGEPELPAE